MFFYPKGGFNKKSSGLMTLVGPSLVRSLMAIAMSQETSFATEVLFPTFPRGLRNGMLINANIQFWLTALAGRLFASECFTEAGTLSRAWVL